MAHFAQLNENNIVMTVIVVSNEVIDNLPFPESEPLGVAFCQSLYGEDTIWKQTSYNGNFRRQYASLGGGYWPPLDVFYSAQPYPSWSFDESVGAYVAPIPKPTDVPPDADLIWDEDNKQWCIIRGVKE